MPAISLRRALTGGASLAAAVALFGAGYAVADAGDNDSPGSQQAGGNTIVTPGLAGGGSREPAGPISNQPVRGGTGTTNAPAADIARSSYPYYGGCQGPIDGVVKDGRIDPGLRGFAMNTLGAGFQLTSLSFAAIGQCEADGSVKEPRLTLTATYVHTRTKLTLSVTQVQQPTPDANVRYPGSATFWRDGYQYTINGAYGVSPAFEGPAGGGPSAPSPAIYPPLPGPSDKEVEAVIDEALAQLAPGLPQACFYRPNSGSWADLGAMGVGDPRPAVPAGYTESGVTFTVFTPPDASCNPPAATPPPASFYATWENPANGGFISVSANGDPAGSEVYPGYVSADSAFWSNGKYQFSVSGGKGSGPLGLDIVRAIAKALDPNFEQACFFAQRTLTGADVIALGLRAPAVPAGYRITRTDLSASELGQNCGNVAVGVGNSYNLNWDLEGSGGAVINVNVSRQDGQEPTDRGGYRNESGLGWWDGKGTNYNVNGYSKDGPGTVPQDILDAVAKSLDPQLDLDKLEKEPRPIPLGASPSSAPQR
ncbi:MAG: hypothetical protein ACKVT1_04965 [Dehalococcoidia bacterium]